MQFPGKGISNPQKIAQWVQLTEPESEFQNAAPGMVQLVSAFLSNNTEVIHGCW